MFISKSKGKSTILQYERLLLFTSFRHFILSKQGNRHLRRLLIEAAQSYTRGIIGYKSKDLKERQAKCSSEVIAYADKANTRLRKKYYHMILRGKNHNIAKAAIARELASFIWGMMTDNIAL